MGERTYSIALGDTSARSDWRANLKYTFACPICGHSAAVTSINQDPYRHFMVEKNAGFLCRSCYAYFDFVGYDEGNRRYLFVRPSKWKPR